MRHLLACFFAFAVAFGPFAGVTASERIRDDESKSLPKHYVLKAARIFADPKSSDGWLENGWIEVKDGKIKAVSQGPTPKGVPVIDRARSWVIPGIVAMDCTAFTGSDEDGIGPRYVAADKFNPFADFKRLWSMGITTARLGTPGDRFISGVGSVVRFGADPESSTVLQRIADLSIHFNESNGRNEPDVDNIPFPSSSDVPYEPKPKRKPQGRMGRRDALREAIREAARGKGDARARAFKRFLATGRPLRIDARRASDIRQAIDAAVELGGTRAYLHGLDEATSVLSVLGSIRWPLVLTLDNDMSRLDDDDFDLVRPWRRDPSAAGQLEAKGQKIIISGTSDDLLYAAAMAVGGGMNARSAIEAITSRPAALLGVADRVGSIAAGKDADFAVMNGDPLSSLSHVQEVWVAGKKAWSRKADDQAILVRAGTIHDGTGKTYHNAEVLIEKGKIVAVGHGVPHPKGARVIDAGAKAVVTPGFIDAQSKLGLGSERSAPGTEFSLADVMQFARPEFAHVAEAGVTTVVSAPSRANRSGSQITAFKTATGCGDLVAKRTAGVKIPLSGSADQVRKRLGATLSRGKRYFDTWQKYEKDLAVFEGRAPAETKAAPATKKAATKRSPRPSPKGRKLADEAESSFEVVFADKADPLSGTWKVSLSGGPIPKPMTNLVSKMRLTGKKVIGTITNPLDTDEEVALTGSFDGKTLTADIDVETPFGDTTLVATLKKAENLEGTMSLGGVMEMEYKAVRTKKGAPKITIRSKRKPSSGSAAAKAPSGPKRPKTDAKLEPFRMIFEGKAGLLLAVNGGPQIRAASEVIDRYGIPAVFIGATEFLTVLDEMKGDFAFAFDDKFYFTKNYERIFLPALCERKNIAVAFATNRASGSALLPRLARGAVREGLGTQAALRALTWDVASKLRLHDTVGALKQGLDGDLLIFDGEPFDARTRLVSVFVRGQEVKR